MRISRPGNGAPHERYSPEASDAFATCVRGLRPSLVSVHAYTASAIPYPLRKTVSPSPCGPNVVSNNAKVAALQISDELTIARNDERS